MKTYQAAIIGAGRIGRLHAENITRHIDNVHIKTIVDVAANETLRKWAKSLHIDEISTNYTTVISDPKIDIVFICSSTDTHTSIIEAAAANKKHIFCEKPIDLSIARALKCRKTVQQSNIKFQLGFNRRFDHNFIAIRNKIRSGAIGAIRMLRITSRDPAPPPEEYIKVSGGLFYDMTIHDFDMLRYLTHTEALEVYSRGAALVNDITPRYNDCDSAIISIKLASGALAYIENCRETAYGYDQRVEVLGETGMLQCTNDYPSTVTHFNTDGRIADKPYYFFLERYNQSFIDEVKAFISSINDDQIPPVTLEDGLMPLYLAEGAKRSFKTGKNIVLADIIQEFN
ncbi:inositol 2-dehydrogenase [Spirochaetota bacterium]|nr:inositol 2-dehydrogenase [Spirochaetota bacterium]